MNRIKHTFVFSLSSFLTVSLGLTSCSKDDFPETGLVDEDVVSFQAMVPGVDTRSNYDLSVEFPRNGITVSAFCPENDPEEGGLLLPHCEGKILMREVDGVYRSKECRWPLNDNAKMGSLKFFAFHPSVPDMMQRAGVGDECFAYSNSTIKDDAGISYDYRLTKFRVAPDISKQVDFVTAIGEGNKTVNLYNTIELDFEHQLSGVQIGVWGASSLYDIEIAGVRIGGIVVEGDFCLSEEVEKPSKEENSIGSWIITDSSLRGYVDYVYAPGDKVVTVNTTSHNAADKVASIMGNGGKAFVLPYKYAKWDHKNDRTNGERGAYVSVLLRMTQHEGDHHVIYPSTDPTSQDYIVYLSVNKSDGTVMKRLDKNGNIFGTDTVYEVPPTEEVRAYGWAAAPAAFEWKAGYVYAYVLDYSKGVGVHDPADGNPASPIVDWDGVVITTTTSLWGDGEIIKNQGWGANSNDTAPDGTVWWK